MALARFISLIGHPMLVMPLAALLAARASGIDRAHALAVSAAIAFVGLLVLGFSGLQVRRGRWRHVDASGKDERRGLNIFLLPLFALASVLAWWRLGVSPLPVALMLAAGVVALAILLSAWCKLSLHMAFVSFAALIPGSSSALLAFGLLGVAVAWSRLALHRHVRLDLFAGLLAGVAAGIIYQCT
jgi:hypothetical protein